MLSRGSRRWVWTILVPMSLALAACGSQPLATEQPDPPSWLVGQEDRTTHEPPQQREASVAVGDSAFEPATLVVAAGQGVRVENTGTRTVILTLDGVDVSVVEPGASKVVSIDLEPGRHEFSLREDPSVSGTLIVT
jgi:plastocyanin